MKLNKLLLLLPALAVLLLSCAPNLDYLSGGVLVSVNAEKHFTSNLTYNIGETDIQKFNNDGSFIIESYRYENEYYDQNYNGKLSEGWVQVNGTKGTYTYDRSTKTLSKVITHIFRSTDAEMFWDPATNDSDLFIVEENYIFTTKSIYKNAFLTSDDFKIFTSTIKKIGLTNSEKISYKYTFSDDGKSMIYLYNRSEADMDNNIYLQNEKKVSCGVLNIFPEGEDFGPNRQLTLKIDLEKEEYRSYDPIEKTWGDWSGYTYRSLIPQLFICGDDYIITSTDPSPEYD